MGRIQRAMCAGMLGLQSVVMLLTTPVLLTLTEVPTAVALVIGLGLTVACVVAAGLMRRRAGGMLGWAVQVASIALGFVVPAMFALGVVFLALFAGSWFMGVRIDRERAEREASLHAGG
jgi:hypothetical protein